AAAIRRRARAEGAALLRRVAARCDDLEIKAWARFRAGRALFQLGRNDEAWAELEALEAEAATHSLADDARFRLALVARDRGDAETTTRLLASIPERYPAGDMRGEALFVLALDARATGRREDALGYLDQLVVSGLRAVPGEEQEGLRGRAGYWRAQVLFELGRRDDALAGWEATARAWPLSYYATHAATRLRQHAPERARVLERAFSTGRADAPLRFAWRAELDAAWFERFLELGRVGAESEARRELEHAGALGSDEELVWLVAACLAEVGALPEVARIVRRRLEAFRAELPVGRARALWRLAYPRAYAPLVETAASEAGVPASFVRAIAREESSFDPDAVSWAHAYGLVQVILPTARRHGASLGVPIDATTLRRPEVNLAVGSRFMRFLHDRYTENPGLVPAAYNAGHGAVDRWLRLGGELSLPRSFGAEAGRAIELDELVERIPYDETRRYTRRVLQTWAVYTWLDEGRLLELPSSLPRR
ncbi:MAG: lytic transglycosylase domain-containing protein, partial [Myxococcales bacterium]|nr:lytic transglycosylase domain-containing protein [Myxococcales bacterium]